MQKVLQIKQIAGLTMPLCKGQSVHYAFPPQRWWRERTGCWHWQSCQLPVQPLTLSIHHRPFTAIEGETDDSSHFTRHIELCLSKWDLSYYRNVKQCECLCFKKRKKEMFSWVFPWTWTMLWCHSLFLFKGFLQNCVKWNLLRFTQRGQQRKIERDWITLLTISAKLLYHSIHLCYRMCELSRLLSSFIAI